MNQYKEYFTPAAILVAGLMVSGSILFSNGVSIPTQGLPAAVAQPGNTAGAPAPSQERGTAPVVTDTDYIRGNPDAPITIVEYSDFECPFCSRFHPKVQRALAEYGDQVRWVYRHFPLDQIHPQATPAAEASECVGEQAGSDGFWQFTDAMFENQHGGLSLALYRQVAQQIGVNMEQFDNCVANRKYQAKVAADQANGVSLGITGTPGSFVNDTPVRGSIPYNEDSPDYRPGFPTLQGIIEAELQES